MNQLLNIPNSLELICNIINFVYNGIIFTLFINLALIRPIALLLLEQALFLFA